MNHTQRSCQEDLWTRSPSPNYLNQLVQDDPTSLTTYHDRGNGEDEPTVASDFNCISTMFCLASNSDAIIAVTGFIQEVNWSSEVPVVPLQVFESLRSAFEFLNDGTVTVRSGTRDQAYISARALVAPAR